MTHSDMKPSFFFLCILFALAFSPLTVAAGTQSVGVGQVAPDITLPNRDGTEISLSSLRGNLVLLYFWVSWDPNSRTTNPQVEVLTNKYKNATFNNANGLQVFTVSLDYDRNEWLTALRQDRFPGAHHTNDFYSRYAGIYGVSKLPTIYLLDANGVVLVQNALLTDVDAELSKQVRSMNLPAPVPAEVVSKPVDNPVTNSTTTQPALPTVVEVPVKPTTKPAINVAAGLHYKIQAGAFKTIPASKSDPLKPYGTISSEATGNGLLRLLVGPYATLSEAKTALQNVKRTIPDAFVVEYNGQKRGRTVPQSEVENAKSDAITQKGRPVTASAKTSPKVQLQPMYDPTQAQQPTYKGSAPVMSSTTTHSTSSGQATTTTVAAPTIRIDANEIGVLRAMRDEGFIENLPSRAYITVGNYENGKLLSQYPNGAFSETTTSQTMQGTYYDAPQSWRPTAETDGGNRRNPSATMEGAARDPYISQNYTKPNDPNTADNMHSNDNKPPHRQLCLPNKRRPPQPPPRPFPPPMVVSSASLPPPPRPIARPLRKVESQKRKPPPHHRKRCLKKTSTNTWTAMNTAPPASRRC